MASAKSAKHKKTAASRSKAQHRQKSSARRGASARKPSRRPLSSSKRKPASARSKTAVRKPLKTANKTAKKVSLKKPLKKVIAPVKKPAAAQKPVALQKDAKKAIKKTMKPVSAESVKKMMKVKAEANQKKQQLAQQKPVATVHKFMPRAGTMGMPGKAAALPPVKMSTFSTTANPAKSAGNSKIGFRVNEYIVYPTHGVGQITAIEEQLIAGLKLELFVVFFAKDRMTLRVPIGKVASVGMRKISESALVAKSLETLKGRPRIKRTMWSRRAQEYEAKINSGDLISVAEVVRDLYRADTQPEQSYSERQLFEAALDRMVREVAVVHKASDSEAQHMIETALQKSPRRSRTATAASEDGNVVAFNKPASNDDDGRQEKAA